MIGTSGRLLRILVIGLAVLATFWVLLTLHRAGGLLPDLVNQPHPPCFADFVKGSHRGAGRGMVMHLLAFVPVFALVGWLDRRDNHTQAPRHEQPEPMPATVAGHSDEVGRSR